jgi:hypothetical protein
MKITFHVEIIDHCFDFNNFRCCEYEYYLRNNEGIKEKEMKLGQEAQGRIAENPGSRISEEVSQAVKNSP